MSAYIQILFQWLPPSVAYAFLALFSVVVILFVARIVKIILDALPFV